jgi:hypothetical protein
VLLLQVIVEERRLRTDDSPLGKYQQEYALRALGNNYRCVYPCRRAVQHSELRQCCHACNKRKEHLLPDPCSQSRRPIIGFPEDFEKLGRQEVCALGNCGTEVVLMSVVRQSRRAPGSCTT